MSIAGGVAGLVLLVRNDTASRVSMRLESGETLTIEYQVPDAHDFSRSERRAIEDVAGQTIPAVRRVLADVPPALVLEVGSSHRVIPETGENGTNVLPNIIHWSVDPGHGEGVESIARSQLRPTLFHELSHLLRSSAIGGGRLRDRVIQEGLATTVERDFGGGASPPWGQSPPNVASWAKEVLSLPDDAPADPWLYDHPDGRRWIGFKVGVYLIDCAMKSSGKTSAQLVRVPTDTLVQMCSDVASGAAAASGTDAGAARD